MGVNSAASDGCTDVVDCDPEEYVDDADNNEEDGLYDGTGGDIEEGNHGHGY